MQNSRRDHIVSCLDIVWESMSGLCESFTEDQWKRATDCPGWSVQDQLSHITGSESQLAGNPTEFKISGSPYEMTGWLGRLNPGLLPFSGTPYCT